MLKLNDELFKALEDFLEEYYLEKMPLAETVNELTDEEQAEEPAAALSFDALVLRMGESFSEMLFRLIDESGESDAKIYGRAGLDRRLFSKIRSNPQYRPKKGTILALAVALRLKLDKTDELLRRAGYALSPSNRADLIVEYFIREGRYNIIELNQALQAFQEIPLGAEERRKPG